MGLTNEELLQKAVLSTGDFGGAGEAPLTIEQVREFLRLAILPQTMLPDVRPVMSNANTWQESKINFDARIMRPGIEGERNVFSDRVKPGTGIVEMITVLLRGEVPITDETMEDQVEQAGFGDTIMAMVAEGAGRDVEELFIRGDTDDSFIGHGEGAGSFLRLTDGWLKLAGTSAGFNLLDATADGQDYQAIFRKLINLLPDRYKRDPQNMRFYVPLRLEEKYRDQLADRATNGGDAWLEGTRPLVYQGIRIMGVPNFPIDAIPTPDTSFILLTHRMNLYAGWRRQIRMETYRDPREGVTSFIVTARVDPEIAHVPATAIAENVDVDF